MAKTYNPWHEAGRIGWLDLFRLRLPAGRGWWLPCDRTIVLDDRLGQAESRSVLAHELEHVLAGDTADVPAHIARAQERSAGGRAAAKLIPIDGLIDALVWSQDKTELAEALWVDVQTVEARLTNLTPAEEQCIDERLWAREWGAA